MLEIILAALGAVFCLGYILSSAANDRPTANTEAVKQGAADASNMAA